MKKRLKGFLLAILISLAAFAIEGIIGAGFGLVYGITYAMKKMGSKGSLTDSTELTNSIKTAMSGDILLLITVIGIIVCGIVFFFWYRAEIKGEERGSLGKVFEVKNIGMLIFLGIGLQFFLSGVMNIAQGYFTKLFDDYAKQMEILSDGNIIVVVLLTIFIAPFTEELIFRGVVLHRTNRYMPFIGANILQAVLFGIYHGNLIQGIYATFFGLILGAVYYKFRSIFACMFLHMTINASAFLPELFPDKPMITYLLIFTGGIALFFTLYLLKKTEKLVPDAIPMEPQYNAPEEDNNKTGTWNAQ